jgi:type I restriction enzyme S subunit
MRLENVCTVFTDGDWIESKDQSESGIRLIQTGNIGEGQYLEKETRAKFISKDTFDRLKCTEIFAGDILVSRLPEPVGRACIIPQKNERMITAVDCTICRPNEEIANKEYLCYFMRSSAYYNRLLGSVTGTTRKRISRKNLGNVELDVPSLSEQKSVVERLNCLVNIMCARQQELQKLDDLIKARFVEMFGNETNSMGWNVVCVEEVADVQVGVVIKPAQYYTDEKNGIRAFRSLNIGPMYIKNNDWVYFSEEGNTRNAKSILKENDLLIVRSGAPGTACVVTKEFEGCNAVDIIIAHPDTQKVNPYYLCAYTNLPHGKRQIDEGTGGAAQQHFNVGKYNKLQLMLPPMKLQQQFADFVAQVDKSKVAVQKALDETQLLFDSLMQEYFG